MSFHVLVVNIVSMNLWKRRLMLPVTGSKASDRAYFRHYLTSD